VKYVGIGVVGGSTRCSPRPPPAGATLTGPPHDRPWGIYSGYFRDLDGHLWEIIWNPRAQA
jgi:predicted lactoylglutathione lyase